MGQKRGPPPDKLNYLNTINKVGTFLKMTINEEREVKIGKEEEKERGSRVQALEELALGDVVDLDDGLAEALLHHNQRLSRI